MFDTSSASPRCYTHSQLFLDKEVWILRMSARCGHMKAGSKIEFRVELAKDQMCDLRYGCDL